MHVTISGPLLGDEMTSSSCEPATGSEQQGTSPPGRAGTTHHQHRTVHAGASLTHEMTRGMAHLKDLGTLVGREGGDAHLGHDLEDSHTHSPAGS